MNEHNTRRPFGRRAAALFTSALLAIPFAAGLSPAMAAVEPDPDQYPTYALSPSDAFYLNANDLDFILRQIQIAEAHAAGGNLLCATETDRSGKCVPSPKLPFGLRTVDGSFNNLLDGRSHWGAADQPFPQWLTPEYRQAESPLMTGAPPAGNLDICEPGLTCYAQWEPGHMVYDSEPRLISNIIVDQSTSNPAAVNAAEHLPGAEIRDDGTIYLPNMAPDEGLSAQTNAYFTFFGQFFDHGLDLVDKGGNGTLVVPLRVDDPLRRRDDFNPRTPYLMLTRATRLPGPDGILGTSDDQQNNETTPYVDQNQTYTSHPSHQFFLREYELVAGVPKVTGKLLDAPSGGLPTWNDVKNQARTVLGIELSDARALDVPQIVMDPYGNFIAGSSGFPLVVTDDGSGPITVEGSISNPVDADLALRTGHAFLEDIAHGATPAFDDDGRLIPRFDAGGNPVLGPNDEPIITGYDNVSLGAHFVTGDGRGNENIALSAVHAVFHAEHNREVGLIKATLDANLELKKAYQGLTHEWPNKRPRDILPGPEVDDWSYEQRLFQAARFVTEMQYQHLVFEEFARTVQPSIDAVVFNENSYNANIDPAITAEFAHVVYRFGHSMLTEEIMREGFGTESVKLVDGFLNPAAYNDNGRLTPEEAAGSIINGVVRQPSSQIDEFIIDTLRNNLLGLPLDLATINLLRGRDTGVPPLQQARRTFFDATGDVTLRPYQNWIDFGNGLKNGNIFGRDASNSSLVNFVAAYGTHPSVLSQTTIAGKRRAASLLVNGAPQGAEFLARIAGQTRHETAKLVSESHFTGPVPVVYLTTGHNFPDALAAGPLAAKDGGPILLLNHATVPHETHLELARLQPEKIVVLGGPIAVAESVVQELRNIGIAPVERLAGDSRYDTAVMMSKRLFPTGSANTVYIATGTNFPDSLVASAIAARDGQPILLTARDQLPTVTRDELQRLAPSRVVVLGGDMAIAPSTVNAIRAAVPTATVDRFAGDTRYHTAADVTKDAFADGLGGTLYVATGVNFPDGLAVGPVAGLNGSPVLLLPSDGSVPEPIAAEIRRLKPENIVILGGPIALGASTEANMSQFAPAAVTAPADRMDYMFSTGEWANEAGKTITGLDNIDFWVGGLAERVNPFGGLLGSTFNFVFEEQLEALQFGDRFYYLFRNQGNQLFSALEANSFSAIIERNSAASNLPANIFSVQDPVIELAGITQPYPGTLRRDPDTTWRWVGDEHIEIHGTVDNDRIRGDEGDDSISAKAGDDTVEGGSGNDVLVGGSGNDVLTDTFGDDVLKGGWGNDALHTGPGFDIAHGGPGDDFIVNGGDIDTIFAGDGEDIILGSTGRMFVFAGEGNDWVEGSRHADLLQGDNADQFQADVIGGDDIVIGRGGDDDIEGEGGDDILVGEWFGTDRHLGNTGFDWITYYGETADVNVDFLVSVLQRPDVTAVRDRYDQLEAMSGSVGNDTLNGIGRQIDGILGAEPELHKMTESTLDLVDGLREMLQPAEHDDYSARFKADGPVFDTDGINNLIVGGPGSDIIQGRGGDDFIDGDLMLRVQLEYNGERADSAAQFQDRIFRGQIDPGEITIVRELVDLSAEGDIDTAVYAGPIGQYSIEDLGDGYFRVSHSNPPGEAEESEGSDVLRNIEVLQFTDTCWSLVTGSVCDEIAKAVLDDDDPVEGETVTVSLLTLDDEPFDQNQVTNLVVTWFMAESADLEEIEQIEKDLGPVTGWSYVVDDESVGQFLQARITFTLDGLPYTVASPWTTNAVVNVNDGPVIPALVTPSGVVVGGNVQASPPTDGDGVETANAPFPDGDGPLVFIFETAADADFTTDVIEVQNGTNLQYTLKDTDVDRYVRVRVEYTDDLGTDEVAITLVVGPVTAL